MKKNTPFLITSFLKKHDIFLLIYISFLKTNLQEKCENISHSPTMPSVVEYNNGCSTGRESSRWVDREGYNQQQVNITLLDTAGGGGGGAAIISCILDITLGPAGQL